MMLIRRAHCVLAWRTGKYTDNGPKATRRPWLGNERSAGRRKRSDVRRRQMKCRWSAVAREWHQGVACLNSFSRVKPPSAAGAGNGGGAGSSQAKERPRNDVARGSTTAGRRRDREPVERLAWAMQELEQRREQLPRETRLPCMMSNGTACSRLADGEVENEGVYRKNT